MRLNPKIRIGLLLPALYFVGITASAQKYQAALKNIDSPGFYKISLQPAFVAKSEADLYDLRVKDVKGRDIPYVNSADIPVNIQQKFTVFPRIEKTSRSDRGTTIIVENKVGGPIRRLWIKLKNTDVVRTMNLEGSDDLSHWFAIEEGLRLEQPGGEEKSDYVQSITFPASSYHYLKIIVNDKNKAPVKFLEAGIYVSSSLENTYKSILPVYLSQQDSGKATYVTIKLNDKYQVNKIHLTVKGSKYFKRSVSVYNADKKVLEFISEAELSSNSGNDLLLSLKTNVLLLKIDNRDNLPLTILGAETYQTDEFIVSYLEKGQYYLVIGNANTKKPSYDLKFFIDSLRSTIPGITHLSISKYQNYHIAVSKEKHNYTLIIWAAIIISLLLLTLLTWKMIGEINKKNAE
ncbi:MAG TPA: DUF3999 family protein [Mucilaginibacter sp.]|jgi:hypothetical protein